MRTQRHWQIVTVAFLSLITPHAWASTGQPTVPPTITKIDPPNWWASLPDPLLLVYGRNLSGSAFTVSGTGTKLLRSQISANGHYAFLWLQTKDAPAQQLRITADNSRGAASASFELMRRKPLEGRYQGFSPADVMYLIMTDRFSDGDPSNDQPSYDPSARRGWHGGDFRGIENHLDYLEQLGVTTLWTTPAYSNGNVPSSYHGYAATDLYSVDSHFGSLADYQRLAEALHARKMKIVLDVVPNHIGVTHVWVRDPPTPDWFHGTLADHTGVRFNFEALIDPHAAPESYRDITQGWFTDAMPDMNQENPLVSTYLIQNAVWWIESAGLDGLRIDTFPYVGREFWRDFHKAIHDIYPDLTTVGEVFDGNPMITSYFAGGATHAGIDTGLDTPFDFPVYFTLRNVLLRKKPMAELTSILAKDQLYPHPERLVTFIGNHDTTRFLSEPGSSTELLKLALALETTLRGMPQIYSGDEIAMTGGEDPDNRHDFPGGFASSTHNAFSKSGRTQEEQSVYHWTSELFHLRSGHAAITAGDQQNMYADDNNFAFVRGADLSSDCRHGDQHEKLFIVMTKADHPETVSFSAAGTTLDGCAELAPVFPISAPEARMTSNGVFVVLPAYGFAIYSAK